MHSSCLSAFLQSWWAFRSDGLQRAVSAVGQLNAGAGSALDEFPCVALEVGGRGALAGRAGPRRTIVLALQRNAEALFFMSGDGRVSLGLRQRGGDSDRCERGREGTSEDKRTDNVSCRHSFLQVRFASPPRGGASIHTVVRGRLLPFQRLTNP